MPKEEIIKEIRTLLALNKSEKEVIIFLSELGYDEAEIKEFLATAKRGYEIAKDLKKLERMESGSEAAEPEETYEDESKLSPEQRRVRYVRKELGSMQNIIGNIRRDVEPESKKEKSAKAKNK